MKAKRHTVILNNRIKATENCIKRLKPENESILTQILRNERAIMYALKYVSLVTAKNRENVS